jgi:RimJ/RimL family protein N-acetyltransferase
VESSISQLQAFLIDVAAPGRHVVEVGPFTAYLDRDDPLRYLNYAIPTSAPGDGAREALEDLRHAFRERDRLPRFEYLHEHAPGLRALLASAGMEQELSTPLMAVERSTLLQPGATDGRVALIDDVALDAWRSRQARAFGSEPSTAGAVRDPRKNGGGAVVVWHGDEIVGGAAWSPIARGVSEIRGVFSVEAFRGRGFGSAATAAATAAAFAAGARTCVLTPGSDEAMRIYARAGFTGVATSEYWADPD